MENGSRTRGRARNAAYLFIGLGLSTTLVFGAVSLGRVWQGEPYPTADPAATAAQVNGRLLAVYDAFGLSPAPVLDPQYTPAVEADVYDCHRRGLAHALDGVDDSAPHEPRTAAIHAGFSVKALTGPQAEAAVLRAERTLNDQGWTVTSSREPDRVRLLLEPPKSGAAGSASDAVSATVSASVDYANGYLTSVPARSAPATPGTPGWTTRGSRRACPASRSRRSSVGRDRRGHRSSPLTRTRSSAARRRPGGRTRMSSRSNVRPTLWPEV
ncbi:hypothetical protein [Kitasatospora sp. NPDC097691]|uniref:hypothetical protein n=1 Tax=Kitasatospora sp. NPDC097691 TaxID=3157231 RepID=UPI00332407F3